MPGAGAQISVAGFAPANRLTGTPCSRPRRRMAQRCAQWAQTSPAPPSWPRAWRRSPPSSGGGPACGGGRCNQSQREGAGETRLPAPRAATRLHVLPLDLAALDRRPPQPRPDGVVDRVAQDGRRQIHGHERAHGQLAHASQGARGEEEGVAGEEGQDDDTRLAAGAQKPLIHEGRVSSRTRQVLPLASPEHDGPQDGVRGGAVGGDDV